MNTNTKIGVCGLGVVGLAIFDVFHEKKVNVIGYDKYKDNGNYELLTDINKDSPGGKIGKMEDMVNVDIIFLCLPTLYSEDLQEYDKTSLNEVVYYLHSHHYEGVVVIKSTVEPGYCSYLSNTYKLKILHNPEFLTAKTAKNDFLNQNHIVIGCDSKYNSIILSVFYRQLWPNADQSICKFEESELMKLGVNCFYATKIQFFNELYFYSNKISADYNTVKNMMLKNG